MKSSAIDRRRFAPATDRNRDPILAVLKRFLPERGLVLEIASGTGQHACHFARRLPSLVFQPTDQDVACLASIEAWREREALDNLRPAIALDVTAEKWPVNGAAAIFNANMVHIAPFAAAEGLMRGASRVLGSGSPMITYGPYKVDGEHTSESNEAFDRSLKRRDPRWGVRDVGELEALARPLEIILEERIPMPANNFCLVWRKA